MKLLNIAAGSVRPQDDFWWNLDRLREVLPLGTPERANLDSEPRYVEHVVGASPLPFEDNSFSGCLISHFIEHLDCMDAARLMEDCWRILEPGGVLLVSVPDASYFRKVHAEDTVENAARLFGEPIHLPDGETTFFRYALWMREHKAVLTEDALWCYFQRAGFAKVHLINKLLPSALEICHSPPTTAIGNMVSMLNRLPFSLVMAAVKERPEVANETHEIHEK